MLKLHGLRWLAPTLLVCTLSSPLLIAQMPDSDTWKMPVGWTHAPTSKEDPKLWECAGLGGSWVALLRDGEVNLVREDTAEVRRQLVKLPPAIQLSKEMVGNRVFVETADGFLVGFDAGEFGGGLWWFSKNGRKVSKLFGNNVHAIYKTNQGIYVLSGLDHMGYDEGKLFRFEETAVEVSATEVADLRGSPEASQVLPDDRILVATPTSVLRVDGNGKIETLYQGRKMFFVKGAVSYTNADRDEFIYPESIVVDKQGDIYVGMRFFALRVRERQGKIESEWLMRSECERYKTVGHICSCTGRRR